MFYRRFPHKFSRSFLSFQSCFLILSLLLLSIPVHSYRDRIVAVVNKEVITVSDLQEATRDEFQRLKAKYTGDELEQHYRDKQREVLNALIDERLQLQEAKAKGLSVTQDEIDAAIRRTPLPPTQTEEEFGQELLLKKLFDFEVRRNVVVEEQELTRYYEANITQFSQPPQYRLKHIFLMVQNEEERSRAKTTAQTIYSNWTPEIRLEDLAAQHGQVVTELGWVEEKDLVVPLAQDLKDLPIGTMSKPIETLLGIHLLTVEEIKEPQPYPFEQIEGEIRAQLVKQRGEEAYRKWLKDLKQKAYIDVKLLDPKNSPN